MYKCWKPQEKMNNKHQTPMFKIWLWNCLVSKQSVMKRKNSVNNYYLPLIHLGPMKQSSHPFKHVPFVWWHCSPPAHTPQGSLHSWPNIPLEHSVKVIYWTRHMHARVQTIFRRIDFWQNPYLLFFWKFCDWFLLIPKGT